MPNQKKTRRLTILLKTFVGPSVLLGALLAPATAGAEQILSYRNHIYPVFQNKCMECHKHGGQGQVKSGLDLSSYATLMKGTKFGPVVVPGDALTSNLSVLVEGRAHESIQMPFQREKLTILEIRMINRWIEQGALNN